MPRTSHIWRNTIRDRRGEETMQIEKLMENLKDRGFAVSHFATKEEAATGAALFSAHAIGRLRYSNGFYA